MSDVKETSITVEVVYRGIFQKTLAQRICRSIVLAARKRGHTGTAFARYGDSPERNGVPAKQFAVVAINDLELEASMAKYEPAVVDVSIAVDDTLVKGVESWAWYGRQPIWKPVRKDGFLLVTSTNTPDEVLAQTDTAVRPYTLVIVPGGASFAGLWVFKDDHTDYRCLGALAKVLPDWVRLEDVKALIKEQTKDEGAVESAQRSDTLVYGVLFADNEGYGGGGIVFGGRGRIPMGQVDGKKVLDKISRETGGRFFEVSKRQPIEKVFAAIEEDLRNQYSIGYSFTVCDYIKKIVNPITQIHVGITATLKHNFVARSHSPSICMTTPLLP